MVIWMMLNITSNIFTLIVAVLHELDAKPSTAVLSLNAVQRYAVYELYYDRTVIEKKTMNSLDRHDTLHGDGIYVTIF